MNLSNSNKEFIMELHDIVVKDGSHNILDKCILKIEKNKVNAVVGCYGVNKSALIGTLTGVIVPDEGSLVFESKSLNDISVNKFIKMGITVIDPKFSLYQELNAVENIFMNRELRKFLLFKNEKSMNEIVENSLKELDCVINLKLPIKFYNENIQQKINLAKLLSFESKLIIIDGLAKNLSPSELENIHFKLSVLCMNGATILYFADDIEEIFNFANCAVFFKNGRFSESKSINDINEQKLIEVTYSSMLKRKTLEKVNMELFYMNNLNKHIINSLPYPIIVADSDGKYLYGNFQFDYEIVLDGFFISEEEKVRVKAELENKKECILNAIKAKNDGFVNKINLYIVPVLDQEAILIGSICICLTESENDALKGRIEDLDVRSEYLKTLSKIEHEINNPLEIISNYLHILSDRSTYSSDGTDIEIMRKEINRIKRIIRKNIDDKTKQENIENISLNKTINEVVEFVRKNLDKQINFIILIKQEIFFLFDEDLLKQVLINLLLNAIEAIKDVGEIVIKCEKDRKKHNEFIDISISDNGEGIREEDYKRIFEPFYSTKSGSSSGLGLSISLDIINKMGGDIGIQSIPEKGSTFTIRVPNVICSFYPNVAKRLGKK